MIDVVKHTEYIVPPSRVARSQRPSRGAYLPSLIEIDDYNEPGEPNVPLSLDWHDPLALLKLFFE